MKILATISKLMLLTLFLMPKVILAQNQTITANGKQIQVSSSLQTVLKQVEAVYINPTKFTINNFYNDAPDVISTFLGLIMHRQVIMRNEIRNVEHINNTTAFENEIKIFLEQLAKAHNYSNPVDKTSMTATKLNIIYLEAVMGKQNDNFINNMSIDPTTIDIVYVLDRAPNHNTVANNGYNNPTTTDNGYTAVQPEQKPTNNVSIHGAIITTVEAPTEINLFGEVSGAAENNYIPRNKEEELKKVVSADAILGTWCYLGDCKRNPPITFKQIEGSYVGISIEQHYIDDPKNIYTVTTVYTITKIEVITDHPLLHAYRNYVVKVKSTCNPYRNSYNCNNEPKIGDMAVGYSSESNEYYVFGLGNYVISGYRKK